MSTRLFRHIAFLLALCLSCLSCSSGPRSYRRGEDLLQANKYEEAIAAFDEALKQDPSLAYAKSARGICYWHLDKMERACSDFEQAVSEGDDSPRTHIFYAMTLGALGKDKAAISMLTSAISAHPNDPDLYFVRAAARHELREQANALDDIDMTLKLNAKHMKARWLRGEIYCDQGRFREALAELDAQLLLRPDDRQAHEAREKVLAAMKKTEKGTSQPKPTDLPVEAAGN